MQKTVLKDWEFPQAEFQTLEERIRNNPNARRLNLAGISTFDEGTDIGPYQGIGKGMPNLGLGQIIALSDRFGANALMFNGSWNPNLDMSQITVRNKKPDALLFSQMSLHYDDLVAKIKQAESMGEDKPLVAVGGHLSIYELYRAGMSGADIAFSGEAPTYLQFMERALSDWDPATSFRKHVVDKLQRFEFIDIPGLSYFWSHPTTGEKFLIETGRPKLLKNFDVMPDRLHSLGLLEAPHADEKAHGFPTPLDKLKDYITFASIQWSQGCPEKCEFCPLPALNHRSFRYKSPDKAVREVAEVFLATGITAFFDTSDNFGMSGAHFGNIAKVFADYRIEPEMAGKYGKLRYAGKSLAEAGIRIGTEITQKALAKNLDVFPVLKRSPIRDFWVGQESFNNPEFADKGQSLERVVAVHLAAKGNDIGIHWMLIKTEDTPFDASVRIPEDEYAYKLLEKAEVEERQKWEDLRTIARLNPETDSERIVFLGSKYRQFRKGRDVSALNFIPVSGSIDDALSVMGIEDTPSSMKARAAEIKKSALRTLLGQLKHAAQEQKDADELRRYTTRWGAEYTALFEQAKSLKGVNGKYGDVQQVKLCQMLGGKLGGRSYQELSITISTGSDFWELPYESDSVLSQVGNIRVGQYHFDGNRVAVVSKEHPNPAQIQEDIWKAMSLFYSDERQQMLQTALADARRNNDHEGKRNAWRYLQDFEVRRKQLRNSEPAIMAHLNALKKGPIVRNAAPPVSPWPIISFNTPEYAYDNAQLYEIMVEGHKARLFVFPGQNIEAVGKSHQEVQGLSFKVPSYSQGQE